VISQGVLSFGIPFALIPLLIFRRNWNIIGVLDNHRLTIALATVVVNIDCLSERVPLLPDVLRLKPTTQGRRQLSEAHPSS
jgi:hypothetical protein